MRTVCLLQGNCWEYWKCLAASQVCYCGQDAGERAAFICRQRKHPKRSNNVVVQQRGTRAHADVAPTHRVHSISEDQQKCAASSTWLWRPNQWVANTGQHLQTPHRVQLLGVWRALRKDFGRAYETERHKWLAGRSYHFNKWASKYIGCQYLNWWRWAMPPLQLCQTKP